MNRIDSLRVRLEHDVAVRVLRHELATCEYNNFFYFNKFRGIIIAFCFISAFLLKIHVEVYRYKTLSLLLQTR